VIKDIYWYPPKAYGIKCNIDGATLECPSVAACGGIFGDCSAATLCSFNKYLGVHMLFMHRL
jgi:hypothetical protein